MHKSLLEHIALIVLTIHKIFALLRASVPIHKVEHVFCVQQALPDTIEQQKNEAENGKSKKKVDKKARTRKLWSAQLVCKLYANSTYLFKTSNLVNSPSPIVSFR